MRSVQPARSSVGPPGRTVGIADADIEAIHGPIGLDLGGNRPAYIALAICAEVLASRNNRDATTVRGRRGPIRAAATRV